MGGVDLLKRLAVNLVALALATFVGAVAVTQVAYVFHVHVAKNPMAPLVLGFLLALIIAAIAPRTAFWPRFLVFTGIFLLELALYVVFTNTMLFILEHYWGGNSEAAKPWLHIGLLIHIITFAAGLMVLRRFRLPKPTAIDVDWAR